MTRFVHAPGLEIEAEPEQLYVRSPQSASDRWFVVEGTALAVWELLDTPRDLESVVDRLRQAYDDDGSIAADVRSVLDEWTAIGLLDAR